MNPRALAIALLLITIVAWVLSYAVGPRLVRFASDHCWRMGLKRGCLYLEHGGRFHAPPRTGWRFDTDTTPFDHGSLFGFNLAERAREIAGHPSYVFSTPYTCPLWPLAAVCSIPLFRRRCAKHSATNAFPI